MYYIGMSWTESYNLPVWKRRWLITRINEELKKGNTRSPDQNTPDVREMSGMQRAQVPANLRRFT